MTKIIKDIIHADGIDISVYSEDLKNDYISLTDIARKREGEYPGYVIQNWLRNKGTISFVGLWESIHNPDFNYIEFEAIKNEAGLNSFVLTPKRWVKTTNAIGIVTKGGRYAATYAHKDIAFEFASAISPVFKLYLIKEFERLKEIENQNREWDVKRILTKNNYLIHTDAIKNYILPDNDFIKIENG